MEQLINEQAVLREMTSDGIGEINVPVDGQLIAQLSEGDKDPMFVTIEVINEGTSRNGRTYDKDTIYSLAEQINAKKPDGYYGHLTDDERSTKYPEPQTIWISATVKEVEGKLRLFAKGYVLPEAKKLRSYLKKAKVAGKNVAVSIYGMAKVLKDKASDNVLVKSMSLESIDWARPGSEGVPNMGIFSIASEMTDNSNKKQGVKSMDKKEVLKSATFEDISEANPELVTEMVADITAKTEDAYNEVLSEITNIKNALGIDDSSNSIEVINEMRVKLNEFEIDSQLQQKVEQPSARKVLKGLVVAEMNNGKDVESSIDVVLSSETGKAIISEMITVAPKVAPKVEQPSVLARKFTKKG